jgi:hypothetical protein
MEGAMTLRTTSTRKARPGAEKGGRACHSPTDLMGDHPTPSGLRQGRTNRGHSQSLAIVWRMASSFGNTDVLTWFLAGILHLYRQFSLSV